MIFSQMMGQGQRRTSFQDHLAVFSASYVNRRNLNIGNKILLPASALQQLIHTRQKGPMMFKLTSTASPTKFTYAGVLEFVAEEGSCVCPDWMFENMNLFEGCFIIINLETNLPPGKLIRIQPHETAFIDLPDPRAILENCLRNYVCLTEGETITINFNQKQYQIDIMQVQPKSDKKAVCINETDVEIDFLPPLDFQDLIPQPSLVKQSSSINYEEKNGVKQGGVFQGQSVRIDGKSTTTAVRKQSEDVKIQQEAYNPRKNKLVNGIKQQEETWGYQELVKEMNYINMNRLEIMNMEKYESVFFRRSRLCNRNLHTECVRKTIVLDSLKMKCHSINNLHGEQGFIPFINERDQMGRLIVKEQERKQGKWFQLELGRKKRCRKIERKVGKLEQLDKFLHQEAHQNTQRSDDSLKKTKSNTTLDTFSSFFVVRKKQSCNMLKHKTLQFETSIISQYIIMMNSEQQILISKIFTAQCHQDFELATQHLEQLTNNLMENLNVFSKHPKIQKILQDNYEIFPENYIIQPQQNPVQDEEVERYYKYLERYCNQTQQEEKKTKKKNPWTESENKLFKQALKTCQSKDWKAIAAIIKTRSSQQVRSHYQKYEKKRKAKLIMKKEES